MTGWNGGSSPEGTSVSIYAGRAVTVRGCSPTSRARTPPRSCRKPVGIVARISRQASPPGGRRAGSLSRMPAMVGPEGAARARDLGLCPTTGKRNTVRVPVRGSSQRLPRVVCRYRKALFLLNASGDRWRGTGPALVFLRLSAGPVPSTECLAHCGEFPRWSKILAPRAGPRRHSEGEVWTPRRNRPYRSRQHHHVRMSPLHLIVRAADNEAAFVQ